MATSQETLNELAATLRDQIEDFEPSIDARDTGTVIEVGDGIARVSGLANVRMSELVEFEGGTPGIAFSLEEESVGVIVTGPFPAEPIGQSERTTAHPESRAYGPSEASRIRFAYLQVTW